MQVGVLLVCFSRERAALEVQERERWVAESSAGAIDGGRRCRPHLRKASLEKARMRMADAAIFNRRRRRSLLAVFGAQTPNQSASGEPSLVVFRKV